MAPPRDGEGAPVDAARRREFVEWCIRHVGLPWAMILSGVAAGLTFHGPMGSGLFALWIAGFEVAGAGIGVALATLAGRVLWSLGIGRHFSADD